MTALAYAPPSLEPPPIYGQSIAAGQIGQTVSALLLDFTTHARSNATDWRTRVNACIEGIARECDRSDWDGYGSLPISRAATQHAQRLVDLLPFRLVAPEVIPDPDGEVSLSWDLGIGHVFSVSVGSDGTLSYAGLLGGGIKRHGMEHLNGTVPKVILQSIDELYERAGATG